MSVPDNFKALYGEFTLGELNPSALLENCRRLRAYGYEGVYLSDVFFLIDTTGHNPHGLPVLFEQEDGLILRRPDVQLDTLLDILASEQLALHSAHFLQILPPPGEPLDLIFEFHEQLLRMAGHLGLRMLTTHAGWMLGVSDVARMGVAAEQYKRKESSLEDLYDAARRQYGPPEKFREDSLAVYRHLCAEAARRNIVITIESSCREWLELNTNPTALKAFIAETGAENLGICVDAGHCHLQGISPADFIRRTGSLFRETHFHDNYGDRDAHAPIGDGSIDWQAVIDAMLSVAYSGTITFEQKDWQTNIRRWTQLLNDREKGTV